MKTSSDIYFIRRLLQLLPTYPPARHIGKNQVCFLLQIRVKKYDRKRIHIICWLKKREIAILTTTEAAAMILALSRAKVKIFLIQCDTWCTCHNKGIDLGVPSLSLLPKIFPNKSFKRNFVVLWINFFGLT